MHAWWPRFAALPARAPRKKGGARCLSFNGEPLDAKALRLLEGLEAARQFQFPDGGYWYDPGTGATGSLGGPALGFLPPGQPLGGKLPADAAGGGSGVFVNGLELHALDVLNLVGLFGAVIPGRYRVDRFGNLGHEAGPPVLNVPALARQQAKRAA